ncbi:geranylgeranyl diphosphate synthase, type II [Clostridium acidisoli DSM 12555]|jgi:geranylgeranyl diphosphate synthase type II|uniref:Farnesyl diphosphate synthase n=1 Tax=Clostridium acidisoli DSM 12555 TaxID=1121291 RepID=A0A1W1X0V3_9CLOT|nr:farnesyl diphosphate synthase [Clostridium acidisoli]SMC17527.1 geranylgeranyl diphosphate synthase, type II [Clostridium acidisoli DSM 12555]
MEFAKLKSDIDLWFKEYFNEKGSYNKKIYDAMYYSLEIGGKRVRPLLLCYTYNMYKEEYKDVMSVACAIEMIHTYSLIHDDLPCMDNDDLRRGHPTNHKVFGDAIAVLAGDGLLNEAMSVMFDFCKNKGKNEVLACKIISDSAGPEGMIGGQVVDILSEGQKISYETLCYMHKKKTGALIKASILSGAVLGNANKEDIDKLSDFGEKLGLAFQIKDDILDVIGDESLIGKNTNSDADNNKTTFITTFGLDECKNKCKNLTKDCLNILASMDRDTSMLEEITKFLLYREV